MNENDIIITILVKTCMKLCEHLFCFIFLFFLFVFLKHVAVII